MEFFSNLIRHSSIVYVKFMMLVFLAFISYNLHAQTGTIYALLENGSPADYELVEKDLATGQSTVLYSISDIFPMHPLARAIINPYDDTYNIAAYGPGPNLGDTAMTFEHPYLFRIHIPTGQIQRIPINDDVHYMEYSCRNNEFYLIGFDYNDTTFNYTKINGFNNSVTNVVSNNAISLAAYTSSSGMQSSTLNQVDGHLYFHGYDIPVDPLQRKIYTLDVNTGNIINSHTITPASFDDIHQMAYSAADSTLYAIDVNYSPNERTLVKIDPVTWTTTPISGMPHDFWYFYRNPPVIDYDNNVYSIIGAQGSGASVGAIHYFNLSTGQHTESGAMFVNNVTAYYHAQECYDGQAISTNDVSQNNKDCNSLISYDESDGIIQISNNHPVSSVAVYGLSGKLLKSLQNLNANNVQVDINDFSRQMFIVNVIGEGWSCSQKLVIQ